MIELRPYQDYAVEQAVKGMRLDGNSLLCLATGAGKSIIIAEIANRLDQDICIFQPNKEIGFQNISKLKQFVPEWEIGVFSATMGSKKVRKYTFATIGSVYQRPELFSHFGLFIIDECFVAGTQIDGRNIEDVKVGDMVRSFNHDTGYIELKRVSAIRRKPIKKKLCLVDSSYASIIGTVDHPYFVIGKGYVKAQELEKGDEFIYAAQQIPSDTVDLLKMQNRDTSNNGTSETFPQTESAGLSSRLRRQSGECEIIQTHDSQQPNGKYRDQRKGVQFAQGNGPQATDSWWKRNRFIRASTTLTGRIAGWVGGRTRRSDETAKGQGLSISLQTGSGIGGSENRSGSGRWFTSNAQSARTRQKENGIIRISRVENITVLEQGSDGRYSNGRHYDFVYDLEVEDNHNFFANDVLVHNCHLVNMKNTDSMFTTFIKHVNRLREIEGLPAVKIIGLTATPYRNMTGYHTSEGGQLYSTTTLKLINRVKPEFWSRILVNVGIGDLIREGHLCPLEYENRSFMKHDEMKMNASHTEFDLEDFGKTLVKTKKDQVLDCIEDAQKRFKSVLVFCPSVAAANTYAEAVLGSASVSAKSTPEARDRTIRYFKDGRIQTVFNMGVLTTGFDHPGLDCIVMLRPTRSLALWMQMGGRGVRTAEGKTHCTIIDWTNTVGQLGKIETVELRKEQFPEFKHPMWEIFSTIEDGSEARWHNKALYSFAVTPKSKSHYMHRAMARKGWKR